MRVRSNMLRYGAVLVLLFAGLQTSLRAQQSQQGQQKIPIIVSLSDVSMAKVPFLVAENEGIYAKNGLAVTLIPYSANAATVHGIPDAVPKDIRALSTRANFSIGGGAPGMVDKATSSEPNDRVIIATDDIIVHWDVVAQKQFKSINELKGKRFAISGISACTGTVALALAKHMGWDPVKDMAILEGDYSVNPLKKGWVDALIAYEVPLAMAMKEGYRPLEDVKMRDWNEPIACNGVWTSRKWAHDNHEATIRFLKSLVESIALLKKDKEVAFRAMTKYYTINDREQQQVIYNGGREMPRKPYPPVDGIKRVMELYDSAAMRRFKPEDFYDDSFMKEIDQSGFIDKLYQQ